MYVFVLFRLLLESERGAWSHLLHVYVLCAAMSLIQGIEPDFRYRLITGAVAVLVSALASQIPLADPLTG